MKHDLLASPLSTVAVEESVLSAVVLVGLLVVLVPLVALTTGVTLLVLVPLAGGAYGLFIILTGRLVAGLASSFFVLLTFNANVPLIESSGIASLDVYLLDIALVGLALFVLIEWRKAGWPELSTQGHMVIGGAVAFTLWSFFAAFVNNGPSQLAAFLFAVANVRYLVAFIVAMLFVSWTDIRTAIYPFLVAVAGQSAFALFQAVNGGLFGLSYLGETNGEVIGRVPAGPFVLTAGQYAGGFTGTARVLVGFIILSLPLFLVVSLITRRSRIIGILGVVVGAILVRLNNTDAGWAAFLLSLLLLAGVLGISTRWNRSTGTVQVASTSLFGVLFSIWIRTWQAIVTLFPSIQQMSDSTSSTPDQTSTSTPADEPPSTPAGAGYTSPSVVSTDTLGIRLTQYTAALDIGTHYPIFGIGGWNFNLVGEVYGLPRQMAIHNTFLAYLAATGIPGTVFYLVMIGAVGVLLLRVGLRHSGTIRLLAVALLCGFIGFNAFSFWSTLYNSTTMTTALWALSGVAVGVFGVDWEKL